VRHARGQVKTCITPGVAYSGAGMGNRCCRCFGDDKNDLEETLIASANTSDAVLPFVPRAACPGVARAPQHDDTFFGLPGCNSQPRGSLRRRCACVVGLPQHRFVTTGGPEACTGRARQQRASAGGLHADVHNGTGHGCPALTNRDNRGSYAAAQGGQERTARIPCSAPLRPWLPAPRGLVLNPDP
jgi:hypothetical protein